MTLLRSRRPLAVTTAVVGVIAGALVLEAAPTQAAVLPAPPLPAIATVKTTPQAKAHMGGNQVTGLKSSATADGCGQGMAALYS